ncbi:MAG: hypothetical protein AAGC70_00110 [Pseudomonadota bacterium]
MSFSEFRADKAGVSQTAKVDQPPNAPASTAFQNRTDLLSGIAIEYGPRDLLAQFFVEADHACRARGVQLVFSTLEDLLEVNEQNSNTWLPIVPLFNPKNGIDPATSYCILGLDPSGRVVATQAVRLYEWSSTSFAEQAANMGVFYADPARQALPGEACVVTAPSADQVRGRVAYSGGVWYHPDYRKRGLTGFMPRIARAFALARWSTDMTMTLMAEGIVKSGVAQRVGYENVEWEARFLNNALEGPRFALLWMDTDHLIRDLDRHLSANAAQIDGLIQYGAA